MCASSIFQTCVIQIKSSLLVQIQLEQLPLWHVVCLSVSLVMRFCVSFGKALPVFSAKLDQELSMHQDELSQFFVQCRPTFLACVCFG